MDYRIDNNMDNPVLQITPCGNILKTPALAFHESFEVGPFDIEFFTDIGNLRGIGRRFFARYDTSLPQEFRARDDEWIGNRFPLQTFLFTDHCLEMFLREYLPDNRQFLGTRRDKHIVSEALPRTNEP